MNGPQNFAEAERLLSVAELTANGIPGLPGDAVHDVLANAVGNLLAAAQVHATLALVAAVANTEVGDMHPMAERPRAGNPPTWSEVLK